MKTWNSTLKSFTQVKLIPSPDKYFMFLWNNVYEFFGTNCCLPKRWPMGPFQLSLPPDPNLSSRHCLYIGMLFTHCFCVVVFLLILPDADSMHFVTFLLLAKRLQWKIDCASNRTGWELDPGVFSPTLCDSAC